MSFLLVKVFFGAGTLGLDNASEISPIFGYGLILMSMSMEGVMRHAREEYLFQLSIYVLESSNSRRLTYFMPPLNTALTANPKIRTQNLIPLLCIRPMRLILSAGTVRRVRIVLLRATHLPFVMMIWAYESDRPQPRKSQTWPRPLATGRRHGTSFGEPSRRSTCLDLHSSEHEHANTDQRDVREPDLRRAGKAELVDVIDAVERLRVEVARVTATLAKQEHSD
ncbi:hypothetical protein N7468_003654 [Penicillium chermesinum]|uniref:Uncharacterized protein n=1 Tax=Penicillium chermesinum TaxID=63820 RepID=A0A9W9TRT8_9EURO|nr:uncharacterized protein N7468_003654 [Penicillium chermesinum]KAJ5239035.1 hypothetical protein N7468_003654 [Penicillium chermesinum]